MQGCFGKDVKRREEGKRTLKEKDVSKRLHINCENSYFLAM